MYYQMVEIVNFYKEIKHIMQLGTFNAKLIYLAITLAKQTCILIYISFILQILHKIIIVNISIWILLTVNKQFDYECIYAHSLKLYSRIGKTCARVFWDIHTVQHGILLLVMTSSTVQFLYQISMKVYKYLPNTYNKKYK